MADPNTRHADNLTPLAELDLDEFEMGLLPVARHFIAAERNPKSQSWRVAFTIASERWGEAIGLPAAFALEKMLRAVMKGKGAGAIDALDPYCLETRGLLTAQEKALLETLHHMRRDDTADARDALARLANGRMDPEVIRAGLEFSARFSAGTKPKAAERTAPLLRVVA